MTDPAATPSAYPSMEVCAARIRDCDMQRRAILDRATAERQAQDATVAAEIGQIDQERSLWAERWYGAAKDLPASISRPLPTQATDGPDWTVTAHPGAPGIWPALDLTWTDDDGRSGTLWLGADGIATLRQILAILPPDRAP